MTIFHGVHFSYIDLNAYLQIVNHDSWESTTSDFQTTGDFPELTNSVLAQMYKVASHLEDIVISVEVEREYNENLYKPLERIQEFGLHIKLKKWKLSLPQIKYIALIHGEAIRGHNSHISHS